MAPFQLIAPRTKAEGSAKYLAVIIHPEESGRPNKVNEYDHTVLLDLQRQAWLVKPLLALKAQRASQPALWPFGYAALAQEFHDSLSRLGMKGGGYSLYGLRHGGASHDRSLKTRCLAEIQQRGGWRSFQSVRRYEKHGRLGIETSKLSAQLLSRAASAPLSVKRSFALSFDASSGEPAKRARTLRSLPAPATCLALCARAAKPRLL